MLENTREWKMLVVFLKYVLWNCIFSEKHETQQVTGVAVCSYYDGHKPGIRR